MIGSSSEFDIFINRAFDFYKNNKVDHTNHYAYFLHLILMLDPNFDTTTQKSKYGLAYADYCH